MTVRKPQGLTGPYNGIYMVTTPMPFPLKSSNGFIADSGQGWIIIDGGVHTEDNQQLWEIALQEIGIAWKQVTAIYLTHYHHDHLGLAGWMQRRAEAPVYIDRQDARKVENILSLSAQGYADRFKAECSSHNWNPELQRMLADDVAGITYLVGTLPELSILPDHHTFSMAGYTMTARPVPGHTDGHQTFTGDDAILFSGDNLLAHYQLHATDWPHNAFTNPLQHFLTAMADLEALPIKQVFPGHGPVFDNFSERWQLLCQHHFNRITQVIEQLTGPMTAWELAQRVFPDAEYIHIKRLILAETLAYLQLLEQHRLVFTSEQQGITYYHPTNDSNRVLTIENLLNPLRTPGGG